MSKLTIDIVACGVADASVEKIFSQIVGVLEEVRPSIKSILGEEWPPISQFHGKCAYWGPRRELGILYFAIKITTKSGKDWIFLADITKTLPLPEEFNSGLAQWIIDIFIDEQQKI